MVTKYRQYRIIGINNIRSANECVVSKLNKGDRYYSDSKIVYRDEGNANNTGFVNDLASRVVVADIVMDDIVNEIDTTPGHIIDDEMDDIVNQDDDMDDVILINGINDNFLKVSSGSLVTKVDVEPESVEIVLNDHGEGDMSSEYDYQ